MEAIRTEYMALSARYALAINQPQLYFHTPAP